jgi:hypothetical protein
MTYGTTPISDEYMREMLGTTKLYTLVLLTGTPALDDPENRPIVWEHGRRNFALRAEGVMPIVGPLADDGDVVGVGILNVPVDEAKVIMDGDPGVQAGLFTYELRTLRTFPGSTFPA